MSKQKLHRGLALLLACALGMSLSACVIVVPLNGGNASAPSPSPSHDGGESVLGAAAASEPVPEAATPNPTPPDGGIQVGEGNPADGIGLQSGDGQGGLTSALEGLGAEPTPVQASAESDEVYPEGMAPPVSSPAVMDGTAAADGAAAGAPLSDQLYSF